MREAKILEELKYDLARSQWLRGRMIAKNAPPVDMKRIDDLIDFQAMLLRVVLETSNTEVVPDVPPVMSTQSVLRGDVFPWWSINPLHRICECETHRLEVVYEASVVRWRIWTRVSSSLDVEGVCIDEGTERYEFEAVKIVQDKLRKLVT